METFQKLFGLGFFVCVVIFTSLFSLAILFTCMFKFISLPSVIHFWMLIKLICFQKQNFIKVYQKCLFCITPTHFSASLVDNQFHCFWFIFSEFLVAELSRSLIFFFFFLLTKSSMLYILFCTLLFKLSSIS